MTRRVFKYPISLTAGSPHYIEELTEAENELRAAVNHCEDAKREHFFECEDRER